MQDSYPSHGIPLGIGAKVLKLMEMGREWEYLKGEWKRLFLMYYHLVIILPSKSVFDLVDI